MRFFISQLITELIIAMEERNQVMTMSAKIHNAATRKGIYLLK